MAESAAGSTGRIFISYRRDETAYPAGWLYDRLTGQYGSAQVFKDIDSIKLGDDFVHVITSAVASCDVLLALIGARWTTVTDEQGRRRIDDPEDFVRLEIEAAISRDVRVIPILIDGARMPRADELPASLVALSRRQALELSPSRFEYDTGRLLKVLDTAIAEVRAAHGHPTANDVPASGETARPTMAEGDPVKRANRRRTVRRALMIGGPLAALLVSYLTIQFLVPALTASPGNGDTQSSVTGEITEDAPWRLVIRDDGASAGCVITLVNNDTQETWSNRYEVYETASFVISQTGTFRWSIGSGCTVIGRSGPGSLELPASVDGKGTTEAFEPSGAITVDAVDMHGNQRCELALHDVATGTVLDVGELNDERHSLTLDPRDSPLVYLDNDTCAVEVSPG